MIERSDGHTYNGLQQSRQPAGQQRRQALLHAHDIEVPINQLVTIDVFHIRILRIEEPQGDFRYCSGKKSAFEQFHYVNLNRNEKAREQKQEKQHKREDQDLAA